jgi:hypothetical protein
MSISRRTFLSGLSAAFGAASMPDLRKRIEDLGRPILLQPQLVSDTLYVDYGGSLFLGDHTEETFLRPSWRQYFADIGASTLDEMQEYIDGWYVEDIEAPVADQYWPEIYEIHYQPAAAAYHYLRQLKIGPKSLAIRPRNGRLDFFAGSNHPGSSDLWVEAYNDLTVSLLQARLIELKQPVRLVMNIETVEKDEWFDHDSIPADE